MKAIAREKPEKKWGKTRKRQWADRVLSHTGQGFRNCYIKVLEVLPVNEVYNSDPDNSATISNITLDVTPVPFESDVLPLMRATVLFGGAIWWKRKRAEKSLNVFKADDESVNN